MTSKKDVKTIIALSEDELRHLKYVLGYFVIKAKDDKLVTSLEIQKTQQLYDTITEPDGKRFRANNPEVTVNYDTVGEAYEGD